MCVNVELFISYYYACCLQTCLNETFFLKLEKFSEKNWEVSTYLYGIRDDALFGSVEVDQP